MKNIKIETNELIEYIEMREELKLYDCQKTLCKLICEGEIGNINVPRAIGKTIIIKAYCELLKAKMENAIAINSSKKECDIFFSEIEDDEIFSPEFVQEIKKTDLPWMKIQFNDFKNKEEQIKFFEEEAAKNEGRKN